MNKHYFPRFSGLSFDVDAQAYLTAANILPGQIYAGNGTTDFPFKSERVIAGVNRFVTSLKANGFWAQIKYMYPFLGQTQSNNLVNLRNPGVKDLIPISGHFTAPFQRLGLAFDAASALDTNILLSEFAENSVTTGYVYNFRLGGYDYGAQITIGGTVYQYFGSRPDFFVRSSSGSPHLGTTMLTAETGLSLITINALHSGVAYNRGVIKGTTTVTNDTTSSAFNAFPIQLGIVNPFTSGYSRNTCGLFFMMDGVNDSDASALTLIVNRFMFDIGRNLDTTYTPNVYQFFGDSITYGQVSNPTYHGWVNNVGYNGAATINNYGIPGHMMKDCQSTDILNLLPKNSDRTKLFLAYSTNDFIQDFQSGGVVTNITQYTSAANSVISTMLAAGYSPSDIIVISGYYCNAAQFGPGANASQDSYISTITSIAQSYGITKIFDMKALMLANGGDSLILGIHPTNAGHDFIGNYISTNM